MIEEITDNQRPSKHELFLIQNSFFYKSFSRLILVGVLYIKSLPFFTHKKIGTKTNFESSILTFLTLK